MMRHGDPNCTGKWYTQWNATMGVTFTMCDKCGKATLHNDEAMKENEIGETMAKLATEGADLLRHGL